MAFCYRTYKQFHEDIAKWLPHVPPISAVAGVPRSGVLAAFMISQLRHIPLVPIESLMGANPTYRPSVSRGLFTTPGPIMVVDDTCNRGRTKREVQQLITAPDVVYAAVYASDAATSARHVDLAGYRINTPHHAFEWNLLRDGITPHIMTDMDGVLCPDWHRPHDQGEYLAEYEAWLNDVLPMRLPTMPLRAVVTARLEKYRPQTTAWLARYGVKYDHLIMHPGDDPAARKPVAHKTAAYRKHAFEANVFIESDAAQARAIAEATGWAVLCYQTGEMHNGTPMTPRWIREQ